jgi:hypothetical protein
MEAFGRPAMAKTHCCPATSTRSCFVASGGAIHRLPLPDPGDLKEKSDLGATAQAAQLSVRGRGSLQLPSAALALGPHGLGAGCWAQGAARRRVR